MYLLDSSDKAQKRLKLEREKARKIKASPWWKNKLRIGKCHYCEQQFLPHQLTLDHLVPLARGGTNQRGNLVPSCRPCNQTKGLSTPVEQLLEKITHTED